MKFHCLFNGELQDGDCKTCLIKRTLPFRVWTKGQNVSAWGCGKWRVSALQKRRAEETVNAQRRPLTEITPPLYNRMPRLYGGQEVKREHCRSSNKQTWRVYHIAGALYCVRALVYTVVNLCRCIICTQLLPHPLCACLSPSISNQHSAKPSSRTKASALVRRVLPWESHLHCNAASWDAS